MVVDSCKFFDAMTAKYTLKPTGKRKYHRNSTMSKAEVMLIIILFHDSGYRCFIETVNDELKNISQVEHSIHRYFDRFIINLLQAITTYFQRSVHQCTKHHLHSPYIVLNPSNSRLSNTFGMSISPQSLTGVGHSYRLDIILCLYIIY